jgi:phenylacetate-coenzyme A ligase PaaK-like adenylate-forming protein
MIYELQAKGIDVGKLGIEKILLSGESSTKERKEKLSKYYNAEIFDLYGTSEFGCVGIDCVHKNGIHMLDHSVLTQIVDPETNKPVADGQTGHVIFTRLIDEFETPGTILINYFIGDESKIISREACECGRLSTRIDYPRRADGAVFVSGAKVDYHDLEAILAKPENRDLVTGEFEIVVAANQDGTYNMLCRVEPKQGIILPKDYCEQIVNALKSINFPLANEASGGRIDLSVQLVKDSEFEICKKPGKPKRIIDRRK